MEKFLQWREMLPVQPPNRPAPSRISASPKNQTGSMASSHHLDDQSGLIHMPPSRLSIDETDNDDHVNAVNGLASIGTVATFTVDHLLFTRLLSGICCCGLR